ncbi:MAG: sugar-binding protein, partial [Anaerolineales bacterium]|nr:sugar-binding protein [Anaerolineales bacterium]
MSLVNVIILIIVNLALYGFIAARLLGWRPPGWSAENPVNRVLSAALAVAITGAVILLGMYLLTSGLIDASSSTSILQTAIWIDCAIIVLLLIIRFIPQIPIVSVLRWDTASHQYIAVAIAIAVTAAVSLVGIILVSRGIIGEFSSLRMLRTVLWVDGVVATTLVALWIFPRLPWPVYGKSTVRSSGEWRQALSGLAIAVLILLTLIGGFFIAYGESGYLNAERVTVPSKLMDPTKTIVVVNNIGELDAQNNLTMLSNVSATFTGLPTRTGTEIPTATPTDATNNVIVTQRATKLVTRAPTYTETVGPTNTATATATATTTTRATATRTTTIISTTASGPTECNFDVDDWVEYEVKYGDTLSSLAVQRGYEIVDIVEANCLSDLALYSGQYIYLPIDLGEDFDGLMVRMSTDNLIVDGNLSDWGKLSFIADQVVYGSSVWNNNIDLSATYGLAWDDLYLYVAIEVRDDIHVQTEVGETIFKGDSVEILFDRDIDNDAWVTQLNSDDYQIGLSAGSFSDDSVMTQVYRWYPVVQSGTITNAKIESRSNEGGYIIEAALPWTIFGVSATSGDEYGFV